MNHSSLPNRRARIRDSLLRSLGVYPSEVKDVLRLSLLFFLVFFFLALFRNYAESIFLKRYGASSLPLVLLLGGVMTALFFRASRTIAARFTDQAILAVFLGSLGLVQIGLLGPVMAGMDPVYPVMYLLLILVDAVLLVHLWNIGQEAFNVRQGRRIFRLLMAGQVLGATLGSLATLPLALALGTDAILPLCGAANLAAAAVLTLAWRRTSPARVPSAPTNGPPADLRAAFRDRPIFRFLCVSALASTMLLPILTYQFGIVVSAAFPDETGLLNFLSVLRAGTTLASFLAILGLGAIYARISPRSASLVAPLNQTLIFAGLTLWFELATAAYAQFSTIFLQRTVQGPANKLLFSLLPGDISDRAQVLVRGVLTQVGSILGAFLLLLLQPVLPARWTPLLALILAAVWTREAFVFRRRYRAGLKQVLVGDLLDPDLLAAAAAGRSGAATEPMDLDAYPEGILVLMEELDAPHMPADQALADLSHPDECRRAQAAASFALSRDFRAVNPLIARLDDAEAVRRAAADSLAWFGSAILPSLELALQHSTVRVQEAILEILRLRDMDDFDLRPYFTRLLTSAYTLYLAREALAQRPDTLLLGFLRQALEEKQQADLGLIFSALWVQHADMRLLHEALTLGDAAVAVEMLEASLEPNLAAALVPLFDSIPLAEKIARGKILLPLPRLSTPARTLIVLADNESPTIRLCALGVIAEQFAGEVFIPACQPALADADPLVRAAATWCLTRCQGQEAPIPSILERIDSLRRFSVFSGMGIRELRAVASIVLATDVPAGRDIVHRGEPVDGLYLLARGRVVLLDGEDGVGMIENGGFFGETEMFTDLPAAHTYRTASDAGLFVISRVHFLEIMKRYPFIGINLCRFLAHRVRGE